MVQARTWQPAPNWSYRNVGGQTYYLYTPDNIQAGQTYPIVLTMHGCCWDGDTSHTIGDPMTGSWINEILNYQIEPFYILAPQNQSSYQSSIVTYLRSLFTQLPIDTQRVIVAGFSMGASGTANFLSSNPNLFSAAMAVSIAGGSINAVAKDVPMWLACGAQDGYKSNHEISVTNIRNANGDSRGPITTIYGVNPRYDVYPITGHGDAMEGLFGTPGAIAWALSHRNDGNHRPIIKFTQASPVWMQILPANTTSITATATATDNDGSITKVEFFLNGELKATVTDAPYQATISSLTPGDYFLTATATDNGQSQGKQFNKTITDSLRFGIQSTPVVTETTLPPATAGVFYRDTINREGGNWPFRWAITGTPPPGLALTVSGRLEGIPTQPGTFTFGVSVTDTNNTTATGSLSLTVGAVPPNVVLVTNVVKAARGPMIPWVFGVHEPFKSTGFYGLPKGEGLVRGDYHPLYDAVLDVGPYGGATFMRPSQVAGDIDGNTPADWLSFDVNVDAKVHVMYPRAQNSISIPSWLNGNGWTSTGTVVKAIRQEYRDYMKQFPAGTVTLGPNDGTATGVSNHYLTLVEPAVIGVGQSCVVPGAVAPVLRVVPGQAISVQGLARRVLAVSILDTRGRVVAHVRTQDLDNVTLPTAALATGTYVIRIEQLQAAQSEMILVR